MSVYFARVGAYMKIGYARDPLARAATITHGDHRPADVVKGAPVDLVGWFPGDWSTERATHELFAEHRIVGEWFTAVPGMESYLESRDGAVLVAGLTVGALNLIRAGMHPARARALHPAQDLEVALRDLFQTPEVRGGEAAASSETLVKAVAVSDTPAARENTEAGARKPEVLSGGGAPPEVTPAPPDLDLAAGVNAEEGVLRSARGAEEAPAKAKADDHRHADLPLLRSSGPLGTTLGLVAQLELELEPIVTPIYTRGQSLEERFNLFHAANPHVANALEVLAEKWLAANDKVSVKFLFEILRWASGIQTTGSVYKLNNSMTSSYGRLLKARRPEWEHAIETRERVAA